MKTLTFSPLDFGDYSFLVQLNKSLKLDVNIILNCNFTETFLVITSICVTFVRKQKIDTFWTRRKLWCFITLKKGWLCSRLPVRFGHFTFTIRGHR